jgi:outer membrane protein OmpA-like peptidoglycan-associated protein
MKFSWDTNTAALSLVLVLSLVLSVSGTDDLYASEASSDIPGSSDSALLKRFPQSHIIAFEQSSEVVPYNLILGSLKKINQVLSPKKSRRLSGRLTRITYRVPGSIRTREVSEHFKTQITQSGEILFTCEARECGSSNYWANTVFQKANLYGPEENQYLLVGQFMQDNQQYLVTVYTIQRGNKRVYTHLEVIEADLTVDMDPASVFDILQSDGVLHLDNVKFDADNKLIDDPKVIGNLITLLNINSSVNVYVVGHVTGQGNLDSARGKSRQRAEQVVTKLVQGGIAADRLSAQGVGPLAPVKGASGDRIDLVLGDF